MKSTSTTSTLPHDDRQHDDDDLDDGTAPFFHLLAALTLSLLLSLGEECEVWRDGVC